MIKVDNIHFSYHDSKIIDGMSFNITDGEKVGIIGPNGAGKTTFFHLLCGILKPENGTIMINDDLVKPKTFNPDIGYIFQNSEDQLFNATVDEDIRFGLRNLGLKGDELDKRVDVAMDLTMTQKLKTRSPHHLSGGEKRMVSIAAVIAMNPKIILYDEPSSNLDLRARRILIGFIKDSVETNLISSHDLEFILETCTRVIIIDNGKIGADGDIEKIMCDEKLMMKYGLERPHSLLHKMEKHKHKN